MGNANPVTEPMPKETRAEVLKHEPVAWGISNGDQTTHVFGLREDAERVRDWHTAKFPHVRVEVVPLYASAILTGGEREAIEYCANFVLPKGERNDKARAATLLALLERTQ